MTFAERLRSVRVAAGLTQAELGARAGVARPNVVAYEAGRREPRFDSAMALLDAAGADVTVEPPVAWTWTSGLRPYAVPSRLWRLDPSVALRPFEPGLHLWWSGPSRSFDLANRRDRCRIYEIVLREGRPEDIESVIDGVLLCEAWPDLVLPRALVASWASLITSPSSDHLERVAS
jgi:transcriptional regulator with XRE-family HTH domain